MPAPPPAYDETLLPTINDTWAHPAEGATPPRPAGSAASFDAIWPAIAPLFEQQMAFNAAVVEHLNRNAAAHREAHAALERALPALRDGFDALVRFESLLVQFLQTITPLSDTHYREIDDAITQLRAVTDIAQRTAMLAKREVDRRTSQEPGTGNREPEARRDDAPADPHAYQYVGFEDRFRGSEADIRARLADYVSVLRRSIERARRRLRPR